MQANGSIESSADAMTLLAVDTQIDRARNRADSMEQRLRIDLDEERDVIRTQLLENRLAQENVADQLAALENRLGNLDANYERQRAAQQQALATAQTRLESRRIEYQRALREQQDAISRAQIALQELSPTRSLFVAERDIQPAGASGKVIAALGVILGGMLGVFVAFAAEFVQAARRRHVEDEAGFPTGRHRGRHWCTAQGTGGGRGAGRPRQRPTAVATGPEEETRRVTEPSCIRCRSGLLPANLT